LGDAPKAPKPLWLKPSSERLSNEPERDWTELPEEKRIGGVELANILGRFGLKATFLKRTTE
jgi:hypothetical protein